MFFLFFDFPPFFLFLFFFFGTFSPYLFIVSAHGAGLSPKTPSNAVYYNICTYVCLFCLVYAKAALLKFILMPSNV